MAGSVGKREQAVAQVCAWLGLSGLGSAQMPTTPMSAQLDAMSAYISRMGTDDDVGHAWSVMASAVEHSAGVVVARTSPPGAACRTLSPYPLPDAGRGTAATSQALEAPHPLGEGLGRGFRRTGGGDAPSTTSTPSMPKLLIDAHSTKIGIHGTVGHRWQTWRDERDGWHATVATFASEFPA